MAQIKLKVP